MPSYSVCLVSDAGINIKGPRYVTLVWHRHVQVYFSHLCSSCFPIFQVFFFFKQSLHLEDDKDENVED